MSLNVKKNLILHLDFFTFSDMSTKLLIINMCRLKLNYLY